MSDRMKLLAVILFLVGLIVIGGGLWMIWKPLAVIFAGLFLVAIAVVMIPEPKE